MNAIDSYFNYQGHVGKGIMVAQYLRFTVELYLFCGPCIETAITRNTEDDRRRLTTVEKIIYYLCI